MWTQRLYAEKILVFYGICVTVMFSCHCRLPDGSQSHLTPIVFTSTCVVLLPPFLQAPVSSYSHRFYKRLCRLTPTVFTSACVVLLLCVKIRVSKRDFTASSVKNSHGNRFKPRQPTLHYTLPSKRP